MAEVEADVAGVGGVPSVPGSKMRSPGWRSARLVTGAPMWACCWGCGEVDADLGVGGLGEAGAVVGVKLLVKRVYCVNILRRGMTKCCPCTLQL